MQKTCKKCCLDFEITSSDLDFYKKISPIFDWKIFEIPTPTLCPDCRQQRRLMWRKERWLHKRTCDATGKEMISMYSPDKDLIVYEQDIWWSDKWDALDYWVDFDFSKSFFSQFWEFMKKVPHKTLINNFKTNYNSNFGNNTWNNKNCYLVFEAGSLEDCMYSENIRKSKNTLDSTWSQYCEKSYELIDCYNCYSCFYSQDLKECNNVEFSINCINCDYCFLSNDLNWKKYFIQNKQYSKQDYFNKIKEFKNNNRNLELREKLQKIENRVVKNYHWFWNNNCIWDYIYNSNNSEFCFDAKNLDNCKYCTVISSSKDICSNCYDYDYFGHSELSYEIVTVWENTYNALFCVNTWDNIKNAYYCIECNNISNCFWCFWLVWKQYCILNKQYTKQEYEKLVSKIIIYMQKTWEWWEFFPSSLSPFWYNETVVQEFYPLEKEQIIEQWFNYSEYISPFPNVEKIIPANKLPENIFDIPDDILNWAIKCEISWKPFRIIKEELEFYRKENLPVPRKHPDVRFLERIKLRNPRKLITRECDKCWELIKTTYNKERKEKVVCEKCYV